MTSTRNFANNARRCRFTLEDFLNGISCEECAQKDDQNWNLYIYHDLAGHTRFLCEQHIGFKKVEGINLPLFGAITLDELKEQLAEERALVQLQETLKAQDKS